MNLSFKLSQPFYIFVHQIELDTTPARHRVEWVELIINTTTNESWVGFLFPLSNFLKLDTFQQYRKL